MDSWLRDLRYALRLARRGPASALLATITLAVGVSSSTAAFSVFDAVLLRPLPVDREDSLVFLQKELPLDRTLLPSSYEEMASLRERSTVFSDIAGLQYDGAWETPIQDGEAVVEAGSTVVSGGFFEVLGVRPALGRLLEHDDARSGAASTIVISYGLWQRHFGGDPRVLGRTVRFLGRARTIVGVAPRGFAVPRGAEVWQALPLTPENVREGWFSLVGRLQPAASVGHAADAWTSFVRERQQIRSTDAPSDMRAVATPLRDALVSDVRGTVVGFSAGVFLLLCIAYLNVAILLLVRGTERERELSVRAALGASRVRIVRQLLTESLAFAALAGCLSVVLSMWLVRAVVAPAPGDLPQSEEIAVNMRALAFALAIALGAAFLAALAPALQFARREALSTLRTVASNPTAERRRQALVVCQVALAIGLLTAAGLLARSLSRLEHIELGFDAGRLTAVPMPLPGDRYRSQVLRLQFFDGIMTRLESSPEIEAATPVLLTPFSGRMGWDAVVTAEGQDAAEAAGNPGLHLEAVLPNYFATTGTRLTGGRGFTEADRLGALPVVIVSHRLSRRLWPGQDPIGKRLKHGGVDSPIPWMTVVGVAADTRYRDLVSPPPAVYVPLRQSEFPARFLLVRSALAPPAILRAARAAAREVDPQQPVLSALSLTQLIDEPLSAPRFRAASATAFAATALVLVAVGLYAVIAAFVALGRRDIGVRLALGASPEQIRRLVAGRALRMTGAGVLAGVAVALVAERLLRTMLFEAAGFDLATLSVVVALIGLVTALACYGPARRAARIDPAVVLRNE